MDDKKDLKFNNGSKLRVCGADSAEEIQGVSPIPSQEIPVIDDAEETPPFTGKDLNAVMWLLLKTVGMVEIPLDVLNAAPGPDILKIERQWDGVNKVWRFFVPRKEGKKHSKLFLPRKKKLITGLN